MPGLGSLVPAGARWGAPAEAAGSRDFLLRTVGLASSPWGPWAQEAAETSYRHTLHYKMHTINFPNKRGALPWLTKAKHWQS